MSKNTKKLVPKLRFPEFKNKESWPEETIGDVCKSFSGGTPLTTKKEYYGGDIPFIRSAEIDRNSTELSLTSEGLKNSAAKMVGNGDILFALYGANSGDVAISKQDGAINQAILCLRSESSNNFIYQFLSFKKNWIIKKYIQGGQGNLSGEIVKSIHIPFPKPEEQQKIADCLSSIDDLISAQSQKVEVLKTHKKGLMQQLFPREGETVPRLRFPEFRDAGEWECKQLKDACEKPFSGGTPSTTNRTYYGGTIPFIRSGEIDKHFTELFLTEKGLSNSSAKLVQVGDVLVALYGANSGEVALSKMHGAINQAVLCLRSKTDNTFLYQYLLLKKDEITTKYLQGGQGNLSGDIVKSIELQFPQKSEQKKIADCLSSIDDLITTQTQKLETLKIHKKGLMQQLFPSTEPDNE